MVNIRDKKYKKYCEEKGCEILANFNLPGKKKGKFCSFHKLHNMIDIFSKKFYDDECNKRVWFGTPGQSATSCAEHRTVGMIKYPKSRCVHPYCNNMSIYGYTLPLHCETHQKKDEYNLVERICENCQLLDILDKENNCSSCGDFKFGRVHLAKQKEVKSFLDTEKIKYESYDRAIDTSCGLERPDFLIDCDTHKVVLEVDENQHNSYNPDCEKARMINISQTIGMPVIFIRYNPDKFKRVIKYDKKITKKYKKELLLKWIKHSFTLAPTTRNEFLRVVYLFFDNFNPENIQLTNIEIY
jgi:hypothetical protein